MSFKLKWTTPVVVTMCWCQTASAIAYSQSFSSL